MTIHSKIKNAGLRASVAVAVGAVALAAIVPLCTSSASAASKKYYVSLGDSYSVGYQPSPSPAATPGYTAIVAKALKMKLANFGCGGATTTSLLETVGCKAPYGPVAATGAVAYTTSTQAAAAEKFIKKHKGQIGLITVSIGGNDVTPCATKATPVACVSSSLGPLATNVSALAHGLRKAAGKGVPIIGVTYPDVLLGLWVYPTGKTNVTLAKLSVTAFASLINPALKKAYGSVKGKFVDITSATGAYTPLTQTTTDGSYGTIPKAVAEVCTLTWFCTQGNIHAKTAGYDLMGQKIVAAYKK
jgi:lysophospholipase L1-like esterase